jgi:hypothetical protein
MPEVCEPTSGVNGQRGAAFGGRGDKGQKNPRPSGGRQTTVGHGGRPVVAAVFLLEKRVMPYHRGLGMMFGILDDLPER